MKINIYLKPRNAKARVIHSIEIPSGEFGDADDACWEYRKANDLTGTCVHIFWNWADSAWKVQTIDAKWCEPCWSSDCAHAVAI